MKTFLCEENVLRHNKRNSFPSYLDHYLITKDSCGCFKCCMTICGTGAQNALDIHLFIYLFKFILKLLLCSICFKTFHSFVEDFHMTSRCPYWCPKTMKRRSCWRPKVVLWELNSFVMQTLSFVPINFHRCWSLE